MEYQDKKEAKAPVCCTKFVHAAKIKIVVKFKQKRLAH
jgi:hypothetical protein